MACTFRVGHQSDHVPLGIADPGDVIYGTIGILDVTQNHAVLVTQLSERLRRTCEVALEMVYRHSQNLADLCLRGEGGIIGINSQVHHFTAELEASILLEGAGKKMCLGQDLKPVADTDYWTTSPGELDNRLHYRREPRDGSGTKIITVGESAGNYHCIGIVDGMIVMKDDLRLGAEPLNNLCNVKFAVGSGKLDYSDLGCHQESDPSEASA